MDTTFGQIAIPLAAMGVTAAYPRRGGPIAAAALGGLGAIQDHKNNQRRAQQQQFEHQVRMHQLAQQDAEFAHKAQGWQRQEDSYENLRSTLDGLARRTNGAGGNVPGATQTVIQGGQEAGELTRPVAAPQISDADYGYLMSLAAGGQIDDAWAKLSERLRMPTLDAAKAQLGLLGPGQRLSTKTSEGYELTGDYQKPFMNPQDVPTPPRGTEYRGTTSTGMEWSKTTPAPNRRFTERVLMVPEPHQSGPAGKGFEDVRSTSASSASRMVPHVIQDIYDENTGASQQRDLGVSPTASDSDYKNMAAKMAFAAIGKKTGDPMVDRLSPQEAIAWLQRFAPSTLKGLLTEQSDAQIMGMMQEDTPAGSPGVGAILNPNR